MALCWKKKDIWWKMRYIVICLYKNMCLECSWEINCFRKVERVVAVLWSITSLAGMISYYQGLESNKTVVHYYQYISTSIVYFWIYCHAGCCFGSWVSWLCRIILNDFLYVYFMYICFSAYMCVYHLHDLWQGDQKKALYSLGLK